MSAPTVADYQQSSWSTQTALAETTPTTTWLAGQVVLVVGGTEDNVLATLGTPTVAGLTFTALSGSPTNTASNGKLYMWSATAGSNGSGVITAARTDTNSKARGIAAYVFGNSPGLGTINTATSQTSTGGNISRNYTRVGTNSRIVQLMIDWNAGTDVTYTTTPVGATQRIAQVVTGAATFFLNDWGDQGAPGTTAYGMAGITAATANWAMATVEVMGTPAPRTPRRSNVAVQQASTWMKKKSGILVPDLWLPTPANA